MLTVSLHAHLHCYEGFEVPDDENRYVSWFSFALSSIYLLLGNFDTWHTGNRLGGVGSTWAGMDVW